MIVCAGNSESFEFATPIGIGLIEAASNLTRLCLFDKPEFILFIGSAGSYGKHNIFDIVESKTAANIELAFLEKKGYTPLDNVISAQTEDKKDVIVNSSNYITTDFDLAQKFNTLGIELENMEFFSVVKIAQEYNIPVGGVFCISNYCNKSAHQDFMQNHAKVKELLTLHVKKRLSEFR